jgi:acyl-CoA synthetase (AMP-forming)/AMP-acid ligase II
MVGGVDMKSSLPWLAEYKVHGYPKTLKPYPAVPTHHLLDQAAKKYPKNGYVQLGYEMKYPEAKNISERLSRALYELGVMKRDRVVTILPTSIQFILADSAISKAGAIHVPCSHLEPPEHLEHKFQESSPKVVFILDQYLEVLKELEGKVPLDHVIVTKLDDYSGSPSPQQPLAEKYYWMTELIASHPADPPQIEIDPQRDLETLLFTGGTTGLPKGCMLSHTNIVSNAIMNSYALGIVTQILFGNIAVLIGLPFFHSYGHCIMHTMTHCGFQQLLATDPRDTHGMLEMIREYHPVLHLGVPTQFMRLLEQELKDIHILGLSGSAALPPDTQEKFEEKGAGVLMEGYGLSELSPVTHVNASALIRIFGGRRIVSLLTRVTKLPGQIPLLRKSLSVLGYRRVGKIITWMVAKLARFSKKKPKLKREERRATIGIPLPDTEVKVIDADTGRELTWKELIEEGRVGEMLLKGPQRMLGYWPEEGRGCDDEGFIHTGDVVRVDEKGYFYIVDRTKDMINVSGYKVYSREIDDLLYEHEAVSMAATIGVPDPEIQGSERVKVFIQLKPEFRGKITEEDFIAYLRSKVAKYAVPRSVEFVDEMPLTEVQKVNKKFLRERELERMGIKS